MYYKKFKLDNGIRCVYVSKRDLHISCINITFKVGSKNESKDNLGISHVLEHMFFKGTKKYPSNQDLSSQIESLGGYMNASTTKNTTSYIIKIHTKYIQKAIDILSEMLLHSLFRKKDIEYEKNVVIEELKGHKDTPEYIVFKEFNALIFKDYPLKNEPIGTIETIQNVTRSSLLNYMKKYYTADNMIITISSNLRFSRIENILKQSMFTQFEATDIKKNMPFQYIPNETYTVTTHYKNITQDKIIIGFPICNAINTDVYTINIISALLTGNFSSRLFNDLREKNPLVYTIHSECEYYQDMGIFYIYTEADTGKILDIDNTVIDSAGEFLQSIFGHKKHYNRKTEKGVLSIILDNIRNLQRNKISKKELEDIKKSFLGGILLESETSETIINYYEKESIYNYDNIISIKQLTKKIEKITVKDILRVCNKYFTKNSMFITILGKANQSNIDTFVHQYKDF